MSVAITSRDIFGLVVILYVDNDLLCTILIMPFRVNMIVELEMPFGCCERNEDKDKMKHTKFETSLSDRYFS